MLEQSYSQLHSGFRILPNINNPVTVVKRSCIKMMRMMHAHTPVAKQTKNLPPCSPCKFVCFQVHRRYQIIAVQSTIMATYYMCSLTLSVLMLENKNCVEGVLDCARCAKYAILIDNSTGLLILTNKRPTNQKQLV